MTAPERVDSRLARSFLPATAVLEVTYACNHACLFCSCPWFAPANARAENRMPIEPELSIADWKSLVAKLCDMGVTNLAFTGGEPLLKPGLPELIEFAATCEAEHVETEAGRLVARIASPRLYLLSNGKAMSAEILALCRKYAVHLSLSLPGLATFAEHTAGGDARNVLAWFKRAKDAGVGTTVGVTVTRKNLFELYETIAEALLAGADSLLMNRFLPGGRGLAHAQELSLAREDIPRMLDEAEAVLRAANRRGSVGTELPKCLVDGTRYERLKVGTRCSAALDFFVVDPSGYVRACNHSPVRLGHVRAIESVKTHPYWKRFVMKDYLPAACRSCADRVRCDGGCREAAHIVGGAVDSLDPALASGPLGL